MSNQNKLMVAESLEQQIERLTRENSALKAQHEAETKAERFSGLKVTEKGGVSFYFGNRYPVTLYKAGWEKLISRIEDIKAFVQENDSKLSVKSDKEMEKVA